MVRKTTKQIKEGQAAAFIDKVRALGSFNRDAELPRRLVRRLAQKLTLEELSSLLVLVT